jgi:hypothetical protein
MDIKDASVFDLMSEVENRMEAEPMCTMIARMLIVFSHKRKRGELTFSDDAGVVTVSPIIRPREELN